MNRHLLSILVAIFFTGALMGQNNYSQTNFRVGQNVYSDISATGTAIAMTDNVAGASAAAQNIGFDFNFNGTVFTQFMIHADGVLRLGIAAPGAATGITVSPANSYAAVFTSTATNFQNVILPLFMDLVQGNATPEFHVVTTGIAPNRICTIQWKNLRDADNAPGGTQHQFSNLEFQVKLYETKNDIEFVYGSFTPSANTIARRNAASGIKANSTSFFGLYRLASFTPFSKVVVFNPTDHGFVNSSFPIRKDNIPVPGFSQNFYGRITNDVNVGKIYYDSISPKGSQTAGRIEALVVNEGTGIANNINVALNILGSNTHNATVNIPSLAAGASQQVLFPAFDLPNKGQQDVQVTVNSANDNRAANNALVKKQVISQSHHQTFDFSSNNLGVGFDENGRMIAVKMYGSGTRKLMQVRVPFGSYRNIVNVRIYEDGGIGGAPSALPLATTTNFFTTSEHSIVVPLGNGVTVTGDYYIAVQQMTSTNMEWRVTLNPPRRNNRYFIGNSFGTWTNDANIQWEYMLEAYEENPLTDIGIERLTSPGCDYSAAADVKVTLRNFSAIPIDFSATPTTITGEITHPSGTEFPFSIPKNSGILAAGAAEELTVLSNYDYSIRGFHRINARTNILGDVESNNDSLNFSINNSIAITRSPIGPVCPLTQVTITGVSFLGSTQWNVDGNISSGSSPKIISPVKTTVVKFIGQDYRGCTLMDSVIIEVTNANLPEKPVLMFGDTILSHRNAFKDTVRVKKLAGHTIEWLGATGTVTSDSALIINQMVGLNGTKIAAAYRRTSDGCANVSDTITYRYRAGVLHNENNTTISVCDTSYYDAGGPNENTGNNFIRTFTPTTPGSKLKLTFYLTNLANFASLQVFDGLSTISPRIEALSSTQNGNTVREFIASNEGGALTVQFRIGSFQSQGWWAGLTCYQSEVYRTISSGNWLTPANWERKARGGAFLPAVRPPVKADDTIYVRHSMNLSTSNPMDQVVVEETGQLDIENPNVNFISMPSYKTVEQPEFLIKGTMNISPRVQLFGEGGQMFVSGRLNNFGKIDYDSVVFNGTTPQILGNFSGASGSMKKIHINNPAGLTMGSDQDVYSINFVRGMLFSSSENLLTLTELFDTGARDDAHVNGTLAVLLPSGRERLFPIGKNGKYRPVILRNTGGSDDGLEERFTAEIIEGAPPVRTLPAGIAKVSELRYFRITQNDNSQSSYKVVLPYLEDDGVTDPANLTIAKDDGAGAWVDIGGTVSGPVPGVIESGDFSDFSDFILANKTGGLNPLPVIWGAFTATAVEVDARLEWETSAENNCRNYEVERSMDGRLFQQIGSRSCNNNQGTNKYLYDDKNPGKGTFYYRLKQVDGDGQFDYSVIRKVSFGESRSIVVYPNPVREKLVVANVPGNSDIRLFDALGRTVLITRKAQPITNLEVGHLPAGFYQLLIITAAGERFVQKVQIIK